MQLHNTKTEPANPHSVVSARQAPRILVVDDETDIRILLQEILEDEGYSVQVAKDGNSARTLLDNGPVDLILLDIWMPDVDGITLLKEWAENGPLPTPVIMMSGHGTVETAVEATRLGAYDFIEKPLSLAKLLLTVEHALQNQKQQPQPEAKSSSYLIPEPVGKSVLMQDLREQVRHVAKHETPVLLKGEAGSGINVIAHYLHSNGNLDGSFRELNIGSLQPTLIGRELFGYEEDGQAYPGILEQVGKGTLLLNDIDALDSTSQAKLSSAIENKYFTRIDGKTPINLQTRLISASHHNLSELVTQKKFRNDLYYRINVLPINLPPLRDHREDVPELLNYYVALFVEQEKLPYRKFNMAAQNRLRNYYWPGNIRELMNLVQRLLITGSDEEIGLNEVDNSLNQQQAIQVHSSLPIDYDRPLREARDLFERTYFEHQLRKTNGSVGKVAQISGIERTHLYRKLRALGIDPKNISAE